MNNYRYSSFGCISFAWAWQESEERSLAHHRTSLRGAVWEGSRCAGDSHPKLLMFGPVWKPQQRVLKQRVVNPACKNPKRVTVSAWAAPVSWQGQAERSRQLPAWFWVRDTSPVIRILLSVQSRWDYNFWWFLINFPELYIMPLGKEVAWVYFTSYFINLFAYTKLMILCSQKQNVGLWLAPWVAVVVTHECCTASFDVRWWCKRAVQWDDTDLFFMLPVFLSICSSLKASTLPTHIISQKNSHG